MKTLKNYLSLLLFSTLVFTSCTKEDAGLVDNTNPDMAILSFAPILDNLANAVTSGRQAEGDIPACSDAAPAYVNIILSRNGTDVVGQEGTPFRINLVAGQLFTQEVPQLQLEPDTYVLEYFEVFDADDNRIWVAPGAGGELANFVDNPLPLEINLGAGVKKYVDVTVLCFDDRMVNEYGYLFFDLVPEVAIKFCIFGNYCDETGRHYPAEYSVSVWSGTSSAGAPLYTNVSNVTGYYDNGDYYAEPLCFALPDTEGLDEYYFEITLRSSDEYGEVEERIIRTGVINDIIVKTFFDGDNNLDYYHFREGCEGDDSPPIFEDPDSPAKYYKTCAYPMNGTTSIALAFFELQNKILKTTVLAANVTPNEEHMQHLHGFTGPGNSTCPPPGADTNNDGLISLAEGVPYYGGVQLALTNEDGSYPEANSFGLYTYQRTFNLTGMTLPDWENMTVVVHGKNVNGSYDSTLPVACGQVNNLQ